MRPRLVLIHGSMASSAQWAHYPVLLPGFDVVAIDLPGHGDRTGERFSTAAALAAIEAAVDGQSPVVLAGHSLGGYLAGLFAGTRPHRLSGLVVMGATGNPRSPFAATYRGFAKLTEVVSHERLGRARLRMASRLGVPVDLLPERADYATLPDVWAAVMADCPPRVLCGVECPVLFINGQFDQMRIHERRYRALVPGSHVVVIPRASHFAPLTHAPQVAEEIRRFYRSSNVNAR